MKEKIIIIDGNAIIHRSFHALPTTLSTKNGLITNAAFGFANFLIKALKEIKPQYAVLTLDKKGPTFRHKIYKDYKATRIKAPQELYDQIPMVKDIAQAFALPIFEIEGYEADDLIGTIAQKINQKHPQMEVIIITGDLDTLQLINPQTKVYTMSRGLNESVFYDEKKVEERYGIKVEQIIDYKSLVGDPSDNIPGVPGIGNKTAQELLSNFINLDSLYKNIADPKIKERQKKLLLDNKESAYLSRQLSTIDLKAPLNFNLEEIKLKKLDKNLINETLSRLEFKSLLSRVLDLDFIKEKTGEEENKFERNKNKFHYQLITEDHALEKLIKKIKERKELAFDTETNSLNPLEAQILGISFSFQENEAYFIDLKEEGRKFFSNQASEEKKLKKVGLFEESFSKNDTKKEASSKKLKMIKEVLEDDKILKIAHNLKYDWQILKNYQIEVRGKIFDTMIASYLLNPENRQHNLDALAFSELNWEKITAQELLINKEDDFSQVDLEKLSLYSCEDADFTLKLKKVLEKKLKKQNLLKLFQEIEMPLIEILTTMEREGVVLDQVFLQELGKKIRADLKKISQDIWRLAGEDFNINSPKQLREILFEKMKINPQGIKKSKTGLSTAFEELEKIKHLNPIITRIQNYRELSKLNSTYIESLAQLVNPQSQRLHSSFNQSITATGRLSSSNPNLQNIPIRTELGNKIRQAFITPPGKQLLSLDYSQIELRILAHLSEDKKLLKAFQEGLDIHTATASEIFSKKPEEVDGGLRSQAKAVNFGIIYGQGPHGLSQSVGISYQEARKFIEKYFNTYLGVKKYIEKTIKTAEKLGYTETILGRKRSLLEINSTEVLKKKAAERMAINSPIQGSSADIIKMAMREIYQEIKDKSEIKMILQVHDELIFEVEEKHLRPYYQKIKKIMEKIITLKVPLIVEGASGHNWGEMEKII